MYARILIAFKLKAWDYLFLIAHIAQQLAFITIPAKFLIDIKHPPGSSLLILMEQVVHFFYCS